MIPALLALLHWFFSIFLFPFIQLLGVGMVLLLVVAALSPFESLGWWAGWFGHPAGKKISVPVQEPTETQRTEETAHYLVQYQVVGSSTTPSGWCEFAITNLTTMTNDIYPMRLIGSVSGIIAFGSGLGGALFTNLTGFVVQHSSYTLIFIIMGFLHPASYVVVRLLVKTPVVPSEFAPAWRASSNASG